jgi:DNA-directed RNA polymerase specialized sigma24 family protein
MAQQWPETGPSVAAEQEVDVLSAGRPIAEALPSFETFYLTEIGGLVALASGLCGRAQAEDVAQEAMLATYRRWAEVGRRDHPRAFARRVCANLAVSTFRRRLVELRALVRLTDRSWTRGGATYDGDHGAVPWGSDDEFWGRVRDLPKRQAQAVALRYVYGLTVAEVARTLGITEGSAKVHLFRGRRTLGGQLGIEQEESS